MADSEPTQFDLDSLMEQLPPEAQSALAKLPRDQRKNFEKRVIGALNDFSEERFNGSTNFEGAREQLSLSLAQWFQSCGETIQQTEWVDQEPPANILEQNISAILDGAVATETDECPLGIEEKDVLKVLSEDAKAAYNKLSLSAQKMLQNALGFITIENDLLRDGHEDNKEDARTAIKKSLAAWRRSLIEEFAERTVTKPHDAPRVIRNSMKNWIDTNLRETEPAPLLKEKNPPREIED